MRDHRGCDRMVGGFTFTHVINAYHYYSFEFDSRSKRGVHDTTICD